MSVALGEEDIVLGVGGFVVEEVGAPNPFGELGNGHGVGAVCVGADGVGGCGEALVGNGGAVGEGPSLSGFDLVDGPGGDFVEVDHLAADVRQPGFLAEEIACTGEAMVEGERPYFHATVFEDHLVASGIDGLEVEFVADVGEKISAHVFHIGLQGGRAVHREWGGATEQSHGGEKAWQTEDVVAVGMGEEDVCDFLPVEAGTAPSELCAFAAVEHDDLVADVQGLARGQVPGGREGRAAPDNMNVEGLGHRSVLMVAFNSLMTMILNCFQVFL